MSRSAPLLTPLPLADPETPAENKDDDAVPDAMVLFTVLYGIYPCNFTAFLREAVPYLQGKEWKGAAGDGRINLASGIVRSKSEVRPPSLLLFLQSSETH